MTGKNRGPIEPHLVEQMNAIASVLDRVFNGESGPRGVGFVLLSFNFGEVEAGRINYISNAEREDVVLAMQEFIAQTLGRVNEPKEVQ